MAVTTATYVQCSDGEDEKDKTGGTAEVFEWIPALLLQTWLVLPALVEEALHLVLLGPTAADGSADNNGSLADVRARTQRLIRVVFAVADDADAHTALCALLRAKRDAQSDMTTLLELAARKNLDADDERHYDACVARLARAVAGGDEAARAERVQQLFKQLQVGVLCASSMLVALI